MELTKDQLQELYNECKRVRIIDSKNRIQTRNYQLHLLELSQLYQDQLQYLLINICNNNHRLLRYCLVNNTLEVHPKCLICGKEVNFNGNFFYKTCGDPNCHLEQYKITCKEKYGVDNYSKTSEYLNKSINTCLKNYGTNYGIQSKIVKERKKQTSLNKYGTEYAILNPKVQEKAKQTNIEKYGNEQPLKSNIIRNKIRQTNKKKYNSELPPQFAKYFYNNIYFDSSYELVFYKFCIDHNISIIKEPTRFEYYIDNIIHYYYPDFQISYQGQTKLVEISSDYTWSTKSDEKKKIIEENNILVILDENIQKYFDYCKEINFNIRDYKL